MSSRQPRLLRAGDLARSAARQFREPMPLTGVLIVVLFVILIWHDPIARAIGTESPADATAAPPVVAVAFVAPAPVAPVAVEATSAGHQEMPLPKHPPVDPFRPLISAQGSHLRQVVVHHHEHVNAPPPPPVSTVTVTRAHAGPGCASTHVVVAGESLWSIAAAAGSDWHAWYAANHSTIGSNPSLLSIGEHLCAPPT